MIIQVWDQRHCENINIAGQRPAKSRQTVRWLEKGLWMEYPQFMKENEKLLNWHGPKTQFWSTVVPRLGTKIAECEGEMQVNVK